MSGGVLLDIAVPLDRFTLAIRWEASGRALGIFGPSGAGKTTLLEAVAGLRRDVRGRIEVDGRAWLDSTRRLSRAPEERGVGYVPQDALLFPHRDVLGNLLAGRRRAGRPGARRLEPDRVLEVLELRDLARRDVASLSGGERQRVSLGRALCSGPDLLLLDEPLAGLDAPLRRRILPYLFRVREEFAVPTLHVSHDATEIRTLCDEVMVLERGRSLAQGAPDAIFTDPAILPMALGAGLENVVRGTVAGIAEAAAAVDLDGGARLVVPGRGLRAGQEVVVGVRAEDLILAVDAPSGLSAQNVLPGILQEIRDAPGAGEAEGQVLAVILPAGSRAPLVAAITAQARRRLSLRAGAPVHLVFKAQSCRVLASR